MKEDKVKCELCEQYFNVISHTHLKSAHNMSIEEYKAIFPNAKLNWNSGKTKETDIRLKIMGENVSKTIQKQFDNGRKSWITGKTKENNEIVAEMSRNLSNSINKKIESGNYKHWTKTKNEEEIKEIYKKIGEKSSITTSLRYASGELHIWCEGLTTENDERLRIRNEKGRLTVIKNSSLAGENNPRYGKNLYEEWILKYGQKEADKKWKEKNSKAPKGDKHYAYGLTGEKSFVSGSKNGMYGKSATPGVGRGLHGFIYVNNQKIIFRSSLELKIYLYFYENDINFELTKHRIKYVENKISRTYNPDIEKDEIIYEIKPSELLLNEEVQLKLQALEKYCYDNDLKFDTITENTYCLNFVNRTYLDKMINSKNIELFQNEKNLKKYERLFPTT